MDNNEILGLDNDQKIQKLFDIESLNDIGDPEFQFPQTMKNNLYLRMMYLLGSGGGDNPDSDTENQTFVTGDLNCKHGLHNTLPYHKGFRTYLFNRFLVKTDKHAKQQVIDYERSVEPANPMPVLNPEEGENAEFLHIRPQQGPNNEDLELMDPNQHVHVPFQNIGAGEYTISSMLIELNQAREAQKEEMMSQESSDFYQLAGEQGFDIMHRDNLYGDPAEFLDDKGIMATLLDSDAALFTHATDSIGSLKIGPDLSEELKKTANEYGQYVAQGLDSQKFFNDFKSHHLSVLRLVHQTFPSQERSIVGHDIRNAVLNAYIEYKKSWFPPDLAEVNSFANLQNALRSPELIENPILQNYIGHTSLLKKENLCHFLIKLKDQELPNGVMQSNYIFKDPAWQQTLLDLSRVKKIGDDGVAIGMSIPEIFEKFGLNYMKGIYVPENLPKFVLVNDLTNIPETVLVSAPVDVPSSIEVKMDILSDLLLAKATELNVEAMEGVLRTLSPFLQG